MKIASEDSGYKKQTTCEKSEHRAHSDCSEIRRAAMIREEIEKTKNAIKKNK